MKSWAGNSPCANDRCRRQLAGICRQSRFAGSSEGKSLAGDCDLGTRNGGAAVDCPSRFSPAHYQIGTVSKAAIASGADGLFIETHPNPAVAKSDGANMLKLDLLEDLLNKLVKLRKAVM